MSGDTAAERIKEKLVLLLVTHHDDFDTIPAQLLEILGELPQLVVEVERETHRKEMARIAKSVGHSLESSIKAPPVVAYLCGIRLLESDDLLDVGSSQGEPTDGFNLDRWMDSAREALIKVQIVYDLSTRKAVPVALTSYLIRGGKPVVAKAEWTLSWDECPQRVREDALRGSDKTLTYELFPLDD